MVTNIGSNLEIHWEQKSCQWEANYINTIDFLLPVKVK